MVAVSLGDTGAVRQSGNQHRRESIHRAAIAYLSVTVAPECEERSGRIGFVTALEGSGDGSHWAGLALPGVVVCRISDAELAEGVIAGGVNAAVHIQLHR